MLLDRARLGCFRWRHSLECRQRTFEVVAIQLVESGLVKSVADIYKLTKKQLLTLDKFAELKAARRDGTGRLPV